MEEKNISFPFQARYCVLGELNEDTKQLWFVLHGYGQLARYFIQKFEPIIRHSICVVAPEGLSKFYIEDISKRMNTGDFRVGATWMTKENREIEIKNYLTYLDTLFKKISPGKIPPVTLLGFSQGAATATRWALTDTIPFERLILWGGIIPPDIDVESGKRILKDKKIDIVFGTKDPLLKIEHHEQINSLTKRLEIKPTLTSFSGGHQIDEETLLKILF